MLSKYCGGGGGGLLIFFFGKKGGKGGGEKLNIRGFNNFMLPLPYIF